MLSQPPKRKQKLHIPNSFPPSEWCDFRVDYEAGMSLQAIADKYFCDHRTVRTAIIQNKSSDRLGSRSRPTLLSAYEKRINHLLGTEGYTSRSIHQLSLSITETIKAEGYSGSERTVRNYLSSVPYIQKYIQRKND